jgi:5-methyltetrahydrofolate--homocysteine methyltransferase
MVCLLDEIKQSVFEGRGEAEIERLTREAIDDGHNSLEILNRGLVAGIEAIGEKWKEGNAFIPEVLLSAQVMRAGISVVGDQLLESGYEPLGKVAIGTVQGDVHDIGKSLVSMMMEGFGFEIQDLGVDVPLEKFLHAAMATEVQIVAMSALLSTTMLHMQEVVKALRRGAPGVKIMVGGAQISQEFADEIGADGYAPDAMSAVTKAKGLLGIGEPRGRMR